MRAVPAAPLVAALARTGDWSEANRSRRCPDGDGHALPRALRRASSFHCPRPQRYEYDRASAMSYALLAIHSPAGRPRARGPARGRGRERLRRAGVGGRARSARGGDRRRSRSAGSCHTEWMWLASFCVLSNSISTRRPVDAVVVGVPGIDRSGPREVNALDARLADPPELARRPASARMLRAYSSTSCTSELPLGGARSAARHARLATRGSRARPGPATMSPSDCADDDHAPALRRVHALGQRATQILLARERAQALERARAHLGRIGAEEGRRDGDGLAGHEREVEREMMALEAPAPGRRGRPGVPNTVTE